MTQDEQRQLVDTEQQLVREFGAVLGEDRVRSGVRDVVQLYAAAPVRTYLPVLVLRQARQQLRQLSETAAV
jgi:hypothetical protein